MSKRKATRSNNFRLILSVIALTLLLAFFTFSQAIVPGDLPINLDQQVESLSEEELEVMNELFTIRQEIDSVSRQQSQLEEDLSDTEKTVLSLQSDIEEQQQIFDNQKDTLGNVLRSYQRRGPGSYLEIILASESLSDLIQRINLLRDLTRNTASLLDDVSSHQALLIAEEERLQELLADMEEQISHLQAILQENIALENELEEQLQALQEDRGHYEARLEEMNEAWQEVGYAFSTFVEEFMQMMETGSLPEDAITVQFGIPTIRGIIQEDAFNEALHNATSLTDVNLQFKPDQVVILMPSREFELSGTFQVQEDRYLLFLPEEGTFYGMDLTEDSIENLFSDGVLKLDLEIALEGTRLREVNIHDGSLELISRISLF